LAFGYICKKISLEGCAGFGFTGKILPVCFPASGVRLSQVAQLAFGVARITSKSRKKAAQNTQKAQKTEHKNVGLYAQKTAHSAY
jgi:hypothetical protein